MTTTKLIKTTLEVGMRVLGKSGGNILYRAVVHRVLRNGNAVLKREDNIKGTGENIPGYGQGWKVFKRRTGSYDAGYYSHYQSGWTSNYRTGRVSNANTDGTYLYTENVESWKKELGF